MEATERALFESGVRHATETADGAALDSALDDLGWRDALAADRPTAVSVLFECQGATTTTSAALDWLLATALGVEADGATVAVVLPPLAPTATRRDAWTGTGASSRGSGTAALDRCDTALVVAQTRRWCRHLRRRPGPADSVGRCRASIPRSACSKSSGEFETAWAAQPTAADWPAALPLGQLALGHELVGAGRTMLELARTHALERMQFGRPIGSFQAVRHRLAESLVALEAAAALLDAAWEDPSPVTAAMAKAFAGRSARTVARHCQQVLAGIGFTTEHPLHRSVRRTIVLDQLLGAGSVLTRTLGADILSSATLPAAFPL